MDFLKIDLDSPEQGALIRLKDDTTAITQAIFSTGGVALTFFGANTETKRFLLDTEMMNVLHAAWTDYHMRVCAHQEEQEARKEQTIAEAKALAASVHFDLETLNVRAKREGEYWRVRVRAVGFDRCVYVNELKNTVQSALDYIKSEVDYAERESYELNDEWKAIVASYRRAIPLEPAEIVQARALLKEAGIENWSITPGSAVEGTWNFDGPFGNGGEISMPDESPALLLQHIEEYLARKKTDAILDAMEQEIFEQEALTVDDETSEPFDAFAGD